MLCSFGSEFVTIVCRNFLIHSDLPLLVYYFAKSWELTNEEPVSACSVCALLVFQSLKLISFCCYLNRVLCVGDVQNTDDVLVSNRP